jgi:hypothetical protein
MQKICDCPDTSSLETTRRMTTHASAMADEKTANTPCLALSLNCM